MADVVMKQGIGYSMAAEAVILSPKPGAKISMPDPSIVGTMNTTAWSWWGDGNNAPSIMRDNIRNCGVLNAGIESKVRMAIGKGVFPYILESKEKDGTENLIAVTDAEVNDWREENKLYKYSYGNIYNFLAYGSGATQSVLSKDRTKIARIKATDIYKARLERIGYNNSPLSCPANMYLCADWNRAPVADDGQFIKKVPVLEEDNELADLQSRKDGYEFAILHRLLKDGNDYYPEPLWMTAQNWVSFTRSIPTFKNFLMKNQMSIKYVIFISEAYWTRVHKGWANLDPADRLKKMQDKYDEIANYLTGEKAAGKTITAGRYFDNYTKQYEDDIKIQVLDDKMKDGKYLPDSAAADKQILFSMFFNPAIWGGNLLSDGASGGAGSGSDIREAYLVQLMLMESERQMNMEILNLVKKYNGWSKKLEKDGKPLVWRYDTGLLTTLDQGGSLKNVIAGTMPAENKKAA